MMPNQAPATSLSASPANPVTSPRQTELDWIRIGAFALLILYHVGMYYVGWDWHVNAPQPVAGLDLWMVWLSPWRMPLLFVVSGAATGLMLARGRALAGSRSLRLGIPLLFGMAVVVPPQPFMEVIEKVQYAGSYSDFLRLYFSAYHGFCRDGHCLTLPTWNHLWFLPYLWFYTMVLALVVQVAGTAWLASRRWAALTQGARLLWLPCLVFALLRQYVQPHFPTQHDLVHDGYDHLVYGLMFLLGCALLGNKDDRHGVWASAVRLRWWALAAGVVAQLIHLGVLSTWDWAQLPDAGHAGLRALMGVRQWAPILAILGFARLHLAGRDGPVRRWLTQAVFPFYIVHQTAIVLAAPRLHAWGWPLPVEALALLGVTLASCTVIFLAVRRLPVLALCFGVEQRSKSHI